MLEVEFSTYEIGRIHARIFHLMIAYICYKLCSYEHTTNINMKTEVTFHIYTYYIQAFITKFDPANTLLGTKIMNKMLLAIINDAYYIIRTNY